MRYNANVLDFAMGTIYLTRHDESRNMARFYTMRLQATLFAEWTLVREWGRIGRGGQVRQDTFKSADEAEQALVTIHRAKAKRGYSAVRNLPHAL
jgi:predicted DNA-binding WGR domain protein